MLEFLELLGFATVTSSKKSLSCANSNVTSLPRKILATKLPPSLRTWVVMFKAESINFNRYDNDEVENTDKNQHNENKTVGC